jgi:peptide deformylase
MLRLFRDLEITLRAQNNPPAVGMALPQINTNLRAFGTFLPDKNNHFRYQLFINPKIVAVSDQKSTKNPGEKDDVLEGCFSVPKLYGAVNRPVDVEFNYWTLSDNKLTEHQKVFSAYEARAMQHEFDHLNGILFTDYLLDSDQELFLSPTQKSKLEPIDKTIIKAY